MAIRNGGNEFAAILQMPSSGREGPAMRVGDRIVDEMATPFTVEGKEVRIGASVGLAFDPRDGADPRLVLKCADQTLCRPSARAGKE